MKKWAVLALLVICLCNICYATQEAASPWTWGFEVGGRTLYSYSVTDDIDYYYVTKDYYALTYGTKVRFNEGTSSLMPIKHIEYTLKAGIDNTYICWDFTNGTSTKLLLADNPFVGFVIGLRSEWDRIGLEMSAEYDAGIMDNLHNLTKSNESLVYANRIVGSWHQVALRPKIDYKINHQLIIYSGIDFIVQLFYLTYKDYPGYPRYEADTKGGPDVFNMFFGFNYCFFERFEVDVYGYWQFNPRRHFIDGYVMNCKYTL